MVCLLLEIIQKHWSQLKRFVNDNPRLGMFFIKLADGEIITRKNYKEI